MKKLILRWKLWYYQRRGLNVAVYGCPYCAEQNIARLSEADGTDVKPCAACRKAIGINVRRGRFNGVVGYGETIEK